MGLADRPYLRESGGGGRAWRPPSGGGSWSAFRVWSVNTWLIAICVAVFVVDAFLPHRTLLMERLYFPDRAAAVDPASIVEGPRAVVGGDRRSPGVERGPLLGRTPDGSVIEVGRVTYRAMPFLESILHYSTERGFFGLQVWRLIGFQFLHSREMLGHILLNMLGLFFFGPMVERRLGRRRYLAFYLLCGICGALLYTLLNVLGYVAQILFPDAPPIPGLLFNNPMTPLVGASAGVYGVLMAGAYVAPNATVLLMFIIPMKLRTLAYLIVGIAFLVILTGGRNAGGEAGHLGGALAGWYLIRHPHLLHDFFDFLGRFDPTARARLAGRPARAGALSPRGDRAVPEAEIDRILDKVHAQGLASLTPRERETLRRVSESGGGGR